MVARLGPSGISGYVYILVFKTLFNLSSVQVSAALFAHYIAGAVGSWFWMWVGCCPTLPNLRCLQSVVVVVAAMLIMCDFPAILLSWASV